jgi:hypothetical protein
MKIRELIGRNINGTEHERDDGMTEVTEITETTEQMSVGK